MERQIISASKAPAILGYLQLGRKQKNNDIFIYLFMEEKWTKNRKHASLLFGTFRPHQHQITELTQ